MDDQIIYCLVSRQSNVLAEYTERTGNFEQITRQLLSKIELEDKIMSYVYSKENFVFHYIVEDGITYLCMADEGLTRLVAFRFLEDVKKRFTAMFAERASTAIAYSLNADFQSVMRRLMDAANDPFNRNYRERSDDKLSAIETDIESTKEAVIMNLEKVLDRGDKMELLVKKSEKLGDNAALFANRSRKLRYRMWCKHMKMKLLLALVCLIILYVLSVIACGWKYEKCRL